MYSEIPTYREKLDELTEQLRAHGHLGLVLVDASKLAQVEPVYGSRAFDEVLSLASRTVDELRGTEVRDGDLLALDERGGNAFLIFLGPRRMSSEDRPGRLADLQTVARRVGDRLNARLNELRSKSHFLRGFRGISTGFSVAFHNPLINPERVIARLVEEAEESVRIQQMQANFQRRCRLQDVLLADEIRTVFQPIVELRSGANLGYEALSRGPAGTAQQSPINLFDAADATLLTFELDRHCRRRAMRTARNLPAPFLLFINVVPQSMYDPDFQGASLIQLFEGLGLSPDRIVLEVSENYAIKNYTLFVDALQNFAQMGFSIAVDDIGAGYSGLENIAHLHPRYLKFDIELIRDIDKSHVKREMTRALKSFAEKMDSKIIAEGIEQEGEKQALMDLGIDYGQGYLLARPAPLENFDLRAPAAIDERDRRQ